MADDPWAGTTEGLDIAAGEMAQERAQQYKLQSDQLKLQGRTVEANIAYQKAQIELRKSELAQQKYLTERSQSLQANNMMANLRGPGNWAQYLDLGRRLSSFGVQTGSLAQIANGGMPQGAFVPGSGNSNGTRPTSAQEAFSGLMSTPQSAMDERDKNDTQLALKIASNTNRLARGSLESLAPAELEYLSSYVESPGSGHDWKSVLAAYKQAGIQQGRRG